MIPVTYSGNEVDGVDRMGVRESESLAEEVDGRVYRLAGAAGRFAATSEAHRFWRPVDFNGPLPPWHPELGPCWLRRTRPNADGYGVFWLSDGPGVWRPVLAHRYAYELWGTIPARLVLDHLCEVTMCVRPGHLEPVTNAENLRRRHARNRRRLNGGPP